jgi:hypothetical protein
MSWSYHKHIRRHSRTACLAPTTDTLADTACPAPTTDTFDDTPALSHTLHTLLLPQTHPPARSHEPFHFATCMRRVGLHATCPGQAVQPNPEIHTPTGRRLAFSFCDVHATRRAPCNISRSGRTTQPGNPHAYWTPPSLFILRRACDAWALCSNMSRSGRTTQPGNKCGHAPTGRRSV